LVKIIRTKGSKKQMPLGQLRYKEVLQAGSLSKSVYRNFLLKTKKQFALKGGNNVLSAQRNVIKELRTIQG
jgi:hypothetical protein